MLAPEFCYTLPQTTRQFTGPAPPEENGEEVPRRGSARGRAKASQRVQPANVPTYQEGLRGSRSLTGHVAPARQRPAGARSQRLPAGAGSVDGRDTDSNDWEDDDLLHEDEEERQGHEQRDDEQELEQEEEEEEEDTQELQRVPKGRVAAGAVAWGDARAAAAQAYGVGSRNGRAQALLGVTAAAAAAEAVAGDEDLDINDESTRTALHAAQEVLNNPAAARILLRLMRQQEGQQQRQPQEEVQAEGRFAQPRVMGMQDPVRPCRSRRRCCTELNADEDDEDDDCGELDVDEREVAAGHPAVGPPGGKGDPGRNWQQQGEEIAGASGMRHNPLNEGRGLRQLAMHQPQGVVYARTSSRTAPWAPFGGAGIGGGRGEGGHRAFSPGLGVASGGMAPHISATGVAGRVGSTTAASGRQRGTSGRLGNFGGGGHGMGRPASRVQAAADADTAWEEDEGAEHGGWLDQPVDGGYEDWDAEEGPDAARRYGAAGARTPQASVERGWARGGKAAAPAVTAAALAGHSGFGRRGGSPHRGRAARHPPPPQPRQFMPSAAHFKTATTAAAAAAAAVAAATAAGEAPLRPPGHFGPVLGKRSWLESNSGGGEFGDDSVGEVAEALQAYQHQHQHYPTSTHAGAYPPPLVLRRLAEELQTYHSRSAAAAAAAAAAAVASTANVPRYPGHILC